MRYNDSSVLENMHISKIFKILSHAEANILQTLVTEDWTHVRKVIIEMILHTDMGKHFEYLGHFRTRASSVSDITLDNNDDKVFVLAMGLKSADLSHAAKNDDLHKKWTELVCEEFFNQGDKEKSQGQPVSMYCDRETADIPKSQAGFIKNICLPLYEAWLGYLNSPEANLNCLDQLRKNLVMWESKSKTRRNTVAARNVEELKQVIATEKRFSKPHVAESKNKVVKKKTLED